MEVVRAELADKRSDPVVLDSALLAVANAGFGTDPKGALNWLKMVSETLKQQQSVVRIGRMIASREPNIALEYAAEVRDKTQQSEILAVALPSILADLVDANGTSVHTTGPAEWSKKIIELKLPVTAA